MIRLGVNIDHIATVRQARGGNSPDPLDAAFAAERGGADGITVHVREDRRHIQERDVARLLEILKITLNLEMAATEEMVRLALGWQPADCCLVPEKRQELTTEGGLDVVGQQPHLAAVVTALGKAGIRVSLFIDPDPAQVAAAAAIGAPAVELHTGEYARAATREAQQQALDRLRTAARQGVAQGLIVNAGHGLDYHTVQQVAAIEGMHELNIGHAIVARALLVGMEEAVREMKRLMREATR